MFKRVSISTQDKLEFNKLNVNLNDLSDENEDYSNIVVRKPWGYEYLIFCNDIVAIWILFLKEKALTSMHCHPRKKTSLVVLQGEVSCKTFFGEFNLKEGEGLLIEKGVFHQTTSLSNQGVFLMEIETPVNKRDLVRLKDKYGRQGQGYETKEQYSKNTQNYSYLSLNKNNSSLYKKRFGKCSMTFWSIDTDSSLNDFKEIDRDDVLSLLKGKIQNQAGETVVQIGDSFSLNSLSIKDDLSIKKNSELLLIKKSDKLYKVVDILVSLLAKHCIKTVVVVPGEANVHILDAMGRYEGFTFTRMQNEKSASLATEASSKLTLKPSVLIVSSGASAVNAISGVANSWVDSVPMVVISGQAHTDQYLDGNHRQLANKSIPITEIVKSITKYSIRISDPFSIRYHFEKALSIAMEGRHGPVWLDLPIDVQGLVVDENDLLDFEKENKKGSKSIAEDFKYDDLKVVYEILKKSSRPVLLAGNGIRNSEGQKDLILLVEKLGVPVLTTRRGADLVPEKNKLFFGRPGAYGQRSANLILQNSDFLLVIGSSLSIPLTGRNTKAFARSAKIVVVNIDPNELKNKSIDVDIPILSDAKNFIDGFVNILDESLPKFSVWLKYCSKMKSMFPHSSYGGKFIKDLKLEENKIYPLDLLSVLSSKLEEDEIVVSDGGASLIYTLLAFNFKSNQRLLSSTGLELSGFSLAGAIGSCVASNYKKIICICEDRGLQSGMNEIQTIIDYKLPIKILVLKSRGHSIIRNIQRDYFGARFVATDTEILKENSLISKFAKLSEIGSFFVDTTKNLSSTLDLWLKGDTPCICEVKIEDDQDRLPRPSFVIKDDKKWISRPLEEMSPIIDREKLRKLMLIDLMNEQ